MEYTVQKLAELAGVTSRTIRYYDKIDLLKPARRNSSGYRIYGSDQVDKLQQILFYRELDVDLETIKKIIKSPEFNEKKALEEHREKLLEEKERLNLLIENINRTIELKERGIQMNDQNKFEGFKKKIIKDNEEKYGDEIRKKYGKEVVEKSNEKIKKMSKKKYIELTELEEKFMKKLKQAFETKDPSSELAQKAVKLHRQWLSFYWDSYSKKAHAGLAQMYVDDERFRSYYEQKQKGITEFFRDAILIYTGFENNK